MIKRFLNYWLPIYLIVGLLTLAVTGGFIMFAPKTKASFSYYRQVTINHNYVASSTSETYPNFAVMISSSTLDSLKTVSNGGHVQNTNGYDVGFYTSSNCTTGRLATERDFYASTSDTSVFWVKQSSISTSTNQSFYMCYGDSGVSTDPNLDTTYGATSTWNTNYKAVWHLPNGTNLTANDSTGVNNATTITATASSTGQIDGAAGFNGSAQVITVPNSSSIQLSGAFSEEAWFYENSTANYRTIISKGNNFSRSMSVFLNNGSTNSLYYDNVGALSLSSSWLLNTWNHLVLTDDGTNLKAYLNGTNVYSNTNGVGAAGNIANLNIGYAAADSNYSYSGKLDEVRISNIIRTADWIKTEYNNQNAPQTFLTIGAENSSGGGGVARAPAQVVIQNVNLLIRNVSVTIKQP